MTHDTDLRTLCERLAYEAGTIAYQGRRRASTLDPDTKSSTTDLITEFDRAAEASIVDILRAERPDDAIVGEEGTSITGTSGYAWHIDPIDGTTNFVYDQPAWCCSVAVAQDDDMVAGAVYVPVFAELFSAHRGGGATVNGRPISASDKTDIATALIATGFAYLPERRAEQAQRLPHLLPRVRDIRRLGSAAVDLCMVACGRIDGYYETYLNLWDAAAGELIAREAGARSSDSEGGPATPADLVVAAPGIHDDLVELLSGGC
ncbi:MAG: inositol monophosphatase [Ilumatobacter coccineus]|uniref:Inositol-1-monophosphatase n=1 Tax=Ilumatobacter coccineus TaxID=467094 RepID=A0A2G6KAI2_9ACTN|nr:MAG: inositol monophosphatase [Ilumatobacter coccineus]